MANSEITNITLPDSSGTNTTYDIRDAKYATYATSSYVQNNYVPIVQTNSDYNGNTETYYGMTTNIIKNTNYDIAIELSSEYENDDASYTDKSSITIWGGDGQDNAKVEMSAYCDSDQSRGFAYVDEMGFHAGYEDQSVENVLACTTQITAYKNVMPNNIGLNLGSSTYYWSNAYTNHIYTNELTYQSSSQAYIKSSSSIVPSASANYSLGSSSYKWNYLYATYIGNSSTPIITEYVNTLVCVNTSGTYRPNTTKQSNLGLYNYYWGSTFSYNSYITNLRFSDSGTATSPSSSTDTTDGRSSYYTTGIYSTTKTITLDTASGGTKYYTFTIPKYVGASNGTWKYFCGLIGSAAELATAGIYRSSLTLVSSVSITHSVAVYIRNNTSVSSSKTSARIYLLAIKSSHAVD